MLPSISPLLVATGLRFLLLAMILGQLDPNTAVSKASFQPGYVRSSESNRPIPQCRTVLYNNTVVSIVSCLATIWATARAIPEPPSRPVWSLPPGNDCQASALPPLSFFSMPPNDGFGPFFCPQATILAHLVVGCSSCFCISLLVPSVPRAAFFHTLFCLFRVPRAACARLRVPPSITDYFSVARWRVLQLV